jgi:hypothetical protein
MALPKFSEADLALTQDKLSQITRALANRGIADPVQIFVDDAVQMVSDYTAAYALAADRWRRLMRPIALCKIYQSIGELPDAVKKAYDDAVRELEEIRDGKFHNLTPADVPLVEIATQPASWGSQTKISMRP